MTMPDPSLSSQLRAAMEWWELAGVDGDFTDDATDWLSDSGDHGVVDAASGGKNAKTKPQGLNQNQEPAPEPVKPTRADLLGPNPPADLDAFREWWLSAPGLDTIGPRGRVAPRGAANPELMVLVIDPEQGDRDILLSGPQGRLLSRIIAAMGIPQESVYFASALPRHTPMADTASLAASGMDEIMQFHVNLVNPRQVLALGAGIPPLLGHALTNDLSHLREINRKPSPIPLFVTEGLDAMMAMPRLKAKFWRRWNEWSVKE
ncbi:MAG: uracil-DNA glycosylase family protein [Erythrobacter sp.]|uniref:uracil-DNA glycosylase family protein n=1 Tax=Erythrobacter sp. TaxID=1042 RepID=UPI0032969C75